MAGAQLAVTLDDAAAREALAGILARAGDLAPAYDEIGATVVSHTLLRWAAQEDPDGRPWRALSPITVALKGSATILVEHGILRGSVTHRVHADGVDIGSNVIYAAIQQLGGNAGRGHSVRIPARPFLGLDDADREDIPAILTRYVMGGA